MIRGLAHPVVCGRAGCCSAPLWGVWGGRCIDPQGTGSGLRPSRSPADPGSRRRSSESTGKKHISSLQSSAQSARRCRLTIGVVEASLTSPHSPTCQLIRLAQAVIWQDWRSMGRDKLLQKVSSSFTPPAPTQVTALVCSPEPQVTEHCKQSS